MLDVHRRIKRICIPRREIAGDVLQSSCYLFYLFNILTVPLEPGLPKILLFLPTYRLLSTCLRKAFLAWPREPFIPLKPLKLSSATRLGHGQERKNSAWCCQLAARSLRKGGTGGKTSLAQTKRGGQHCWSCLHYLMQHGSCSQD